MGTWGAVVGLSLQAWAGRAERGLPHACTPAPARHLQLGQSPPVPKGALHISGQMSKG